MCSNALIRLQWILTPPGPDCMIEYDQDHRPVGIITSLCDGHNNNHSVVLEAVSDLSYISTLNITLKESVTLTCTDTFGPQSTTLSIAGNCSRYTLHRH